MLQWIVREAAGAPAIAPRARPMRQPGRFDSDYAGDAAGTGETACSEWADCSASQPAGELRPDVNVLPKVHGPESLRNLPKGNLPFRQRDLGL
jgi:hypothetical protein